VGWCSGMIAGLVAATPASGFITPWASIILGVVTGIVANLGTKIKHWISVDDSMDVLAEHALPGILGLIFNGIFTASYIVSLDGVTGGDAAIKGGWVEGNWVLLAWQLAYIAAATGYSFVVSLILAYVLNKIPGMHLRASEEDELNGIDAAEIGEFAYDYIEVRRDYLAWTPMHRRKPSEKDATSIAPEDLHGIPEHKSMLAEVSMLSELKSAEEPSEVETVAPPAAVAAPAQATSHKRVAGDRHAAAVVEQ